MKRSSLTLPDLTVVRQTLAGCAYRAQSDDSGYIGIIDVRFSPFNSWYEIDSWWEGRFLERTVPGAFKRTIDAHNASKNVDAHNMKTLFNHGSDPSIGDKLLGDILEYAEDDDSPRSTVGLWDTSYNRDLLPGLRSGAYGSSYIFRTIQEEWNEEPGRSDHNPEGLPERTLKEVRVFEAGPVTWPASPTATANARCVSGTDAYYESLSRRMPDVVGIMRSKVEALRSIGPAETDPTDPTSGHSGGLTHAQRRMRLYPSLCD